jgi:hypothetical protein
MTEPFGPEGLSLDLAQGPGLELVAAGQRLGAAELGRLGLLISGDELLPPGRQRAPGQIWESNSVLLAALLEQRGYGVTQQRVVEAYPSVILPMCWSCCCWSNLEPGAASRRVPERGGRL